MIPPGPNRGLPMKSIPPWLGEGLQPQMVCLRARPPLYRVLVALAAPSNFGQGAGCSDNYLQRRLVDENVVSRACRDAPP